MAVRLLELDYEGTVKLAVPFFFSYPSQPAHQIAKTTCEKVENSTEQWLIVTKGLVTLVDQIGQA